MTDRRCKLAPIRDVEDHRARICLEKICEFMKKEERGIQEVSLLEFQQWIGKRIHSPNESTEYIKRKERKNTTTLSENRL